MVDAIKYPIQLKGTIRKVYETFESLFSEWMDTWAVFGVVGSPAVLCGACVGVETEGWAMVVLEPILQSAERNLFLI